MRLLFDHGTLVLAEAPDLRLDFVPGLVWDPRVALFRAPAFRYAEVRAALGARGLRCVDEVSAPRAPEPAPWQDVPLRPYQRAALLAWELAEQRGLVVMPTGSGKTRVALGAMASSGCRTGSPVTVEIISILPRCGAMPASDCRSSSISGST